VVYVVEVLVVIQYSALVVRSGYLKCSGILAALLCGTQAACVAKFCGMGQGRELRNFCSSFVPPIFGIAAITLGIGPHSSCTGCLNPVTMAVLGGKGV